MSRPAKLIDFCGKTTTADVIAVDFPQTTARRIQRLYNAGVRGMDLIKPPNSKFSHVPVAPGPVKIQHWGFAETRL